MEPDPDYRAYLLRIWKARDNGDCWRASLEDAHTRELHVFAEIAGVFSYLEAMTTHTLAEGREHTYLPGPTESSPLGQAKEDLQDLS